jgi:hypothetical protein
MQPVSFTHYCLDRGENTMHKLIYGGILIGMFAIASSNAQTQAIEPLSMKYNAQMFDVPPVRSKTNCPVKLVSVVDARMNKDTLGTNFANPLLSGDAGPWATAGLQNLKAFGFPVEMITAANPQAGSITIASRITRAYTWQVGMKLFGTVAVKVDYVFPSGARESKTFRANGDKTNMWGADDEFMVTLNYAFNNLLSKIAVDLEKRCGMVS